MPYDWLVRNHSGDVRAPTLPNYHVPEFQNNHVGRDRAAGVLAELIPAIRALLCRQDVDARHKAGHDVGA